MKCEAQIVHAIVAVGEPEIDVTSAELNSMDFIVSMLVTTNDGRIVDGLATFAFQYAGLNPYLIGTR